MSRKYNDVDHAYACSKQFMTGIDSLSTRRSPLQIVSCCLQSMLYYFPGDESTTFAWAFYVLYIAYLMRAGCTLNERIEEVEPRLLEAINTYARRSQA